MSYRHILMRKYPPHILYYYNTNYELRFTNNLRSMLLSRENCLIAFVAYARRAWIIDHGSNIRVGTPWEQAIDHRRERSIIN